MLRIPGNEKLGSFLFSLAGADDKTFFHLRGDHGLLKQSFVDNFTQAKAIEPQTVQIIEQIIAPLRVGYFVNAIAPLLDLLRSRSVNPCMKNRLF